MLIMVECFVANYECLDGVVGIRFLKILEMLHASKERNVNKKRRCFQKQHMYIVMK